MGTKITGITRSSVRVPVVLRLIAFKFPSLLVHVLPVLRPVKVRWLAWRLEPRSHSVTSMPTMGSIRS